MSGRLLDAHAVYSVHGFRPPAPAVQMGGWGFDITLSLAFAQRCFAVPLTDEQRSRVNAEVRDTILARLFPATRLEDFQHRPVLHWVEGTLLLGGLEVPGINGCTLMLEDVLGLHHPARPTDALRYAPHNVDSVLQATALLSGWLHWMMKATATVYRA